MIGIRAIGAYIPPTRRDNLSLATRFGLKPNFVTDKIGIRSVARKKSDQSASDLCVEAFTDLCQSTPGFYPGDVDFVCVCTQNGDFRLPQTAALLQHRLGLPQSCASFDLSLGCSGYVYGLLVAKSFMEANDLACGLLFTADPYSDIIDPNDKNTDLLFGDAATVTLLGKAPILHLGRGIFFTDGENHLTLRSERESPTLHMDGRGIFNFVLRHVPNVMERCLEVNGLMKDDIDAFLLHQASKYVIDNLVARMRLPADRVPFEIGNYGNTVSSSIPLLLRARLSDASLNVTLLCGFGVGLSVASLVARRKV